MTDSKSQLHRKAIQRGEHPANAVSFKPEVQVNGRDEWAGNGLRFATREEAERNVEHLMNRWLLVTDTRVVESTDPVTHRWVFGQLESI